MRKTIIPIIAFALILAATATVPLLIGTAGAVTPNGRLQIVHLNVAQGDAAVIISPLGQVVMIDDGQSSLVTAQLQALEITHVDHHFASHYHADHIKYFGTIFAPGGVILDYGWDRGGSYSTGTYATYVATLGSRRRTLVKNQVITLDSLSAHPVTITCVDLAGAGTGTSDENSLSLVLRVSYGEFDEVFGGDLQGSGPDVESIVGPEVGPVEVYKVHHHGSDTSSRTNWLDATRPQIGVISVGPNGYGHPTAGALGRLHTAGVHTYWTQTGSGTPDPAWDTVANSWIVVSAAWEPAGVDTIRGDGFADTFVNSGTPVDVANEPGSTLLALGHPRPNPGRGTTLLSFSLPQAGRARLEILDVNGRRLWQTEGSFQAGLQSWRWDGVASSGDRVGVGLYFVRLVTPWGNRTERLVWLR